MRAESKTTADTGWERATKGISELRKERDRERAKYRNSELRKERNTERTTNGKGRVGKERPKSKSGGLDREGRSDR